MSISKLLRIAGILFTTALTALSETKPTLRVDANLVLVPVTITDARGALVKNLQSSDFTLDEEKRPQDIISFSHETAPVSLGIVVDLSGSMAKKWHGPERREYQGHKLPSELRRNPDNHFGPSPVRS